MFIPRGFGESAVMTKLGRMVYYTAQGDLWNADTAKETLVFLHAFGGGSSAYEWSKVYPAFAADYRILAPDLVGWGRSAHPVYNYRVDDYINSIVEFIEQTCDRPITVVASSLTAAFTIRAAINRPELFDSLIVTTAAGLMEFGNDYRGTGFANFVRLLKNSVFAKLFYRLGVANSWGVKAFLKSQQFDEIDRIYPEMVEAYVQSAQQENAEYAALSFLRGDLSFDLSQYIRDLRVPTTMIWGKGSKLTKPDVGRRLAEMNPQAIRNFYYLSDVGLTPQLEQPAITIGLIRKSLQRTLQRI
jgi:pimeloyl-ACP methyl ester carboxylesterase